MLSQRNSLLRHRPVLAPARPPAPPTPDFTGGGVKIGKMLVKMDGTIESDQMQLIADALVSKNTARQTFRNIIILRARGH